MESVRKTIFFFLKIVRDLIADYNCTTKFMIFQKTKAHNV